MTSGEIPQKLPKAKRLLYYSNSYGLKQYNLEE
jgi:hypothetical protein